MPNACFKVEKRERYVIGREYCYGILPTKHYALDRKERLSFVGGL